MTQHIESFDQFQANVEVWAVAKGIYKHSNLYAQILKGVSELGELADATIKKQEDEFKDAIGDVLVCLVNATRIAGMGLSSTLRIRGIDLNRMEKDIEVFIGHEDRPVQDHVMQACGLMGDVCHKALSLDEPGGRNEFQTAIRDITIQLMMAAVANNLHIADCLQCAWDEIKDRKGHMVEGGAFVKD